MAVGGQYWTATNGLVATGSLASNQYYVVKHGSTAGTVKVATTPATDTLVGILMNDPASGEAAEVAVLGVVRAAAEASVTAGAALTCSSTGRVKATTTDLHQVVGYALEASSSAGDLINIVVARQTLADA